jgi:hypothetical protein
MLILVSVISFGCILAAAAGAYRAEKRRSAYLWLLTGEGLLLLLLFAPNQFSLLAQLPEPASTLIFWGLVVLGGLTFVMVVRTRA